MSSDLIIMNLIHTVFETAGILTFVWLLVRGLRGEIAILRNTINVQSEAMKVIQGGLVNFATIGDVYGKFLSNLPQEIEQYKNLISKLKDEKIAELERANQAKDEQLKSLAEAKLKEIEISERMVNELPKLIEQLKDDLEAVQERIKLLTPEAPRLSITPKIWI